MHDDLGVTARAEPVAECDQLRYQLLIVVDLAVEYDDDAGIFVVERLLAGRDVDDREPPMTQTQAWLDVKAAFVRATVVLRLVHAGKQSLADFPPLPDIKYSDDAAHGARLALPRQPCAVRRGCR